MRKNKEMTFKKQFLGMIFSHIKISLVILFLFYFFLVGLWAVNILSTVMGYLVLIIYAFSMAGAGNAIAVYDLKSYTKTKAYPTKGILLSIGVIVSNLLVFGLKQLIWIVFGAESIVRFIMIIVFFFWTVPYNSFLHMNGADISVIGHVLLYTVPVISVALGYLAGYKKWDIYEKLDALTFEKKQ